MPEEQAILIVLGSVAVAGAAIFAEYAWRRMTGRWPPKGKPGPIIPHGAAVGASAIAGSPEDDKNGGEGGEGGGGDGGSD
jgi:hypothetical protein